MLLAGDVGGTKTLLGLFAKAPHRPTPVAVESFPTVEYEGLVPMIREFLRHQPAGEPSVEAACFGVAGPVLDDVAELTNVSWTVDGKAVALEFGLARVRLLNDLVSIAHSVSVLHPEELHVLQAGSPNLRGNAALLAAGTGMGQSFLFNDGRHLVPAPSEGGHADFAARTPREWQLVQWLDGALRPRGSRDGRVGHRPEQPLPFRAWRRPVCRARCRDAARPAEGRLREGARARRARTASR